MYDKDNNAEELVFRLNFMLAVQPKYYVIKLAA